MVAEEQKISLTVSEGLLSNLQGMFYKLTSPPDLTTTYVSPGCLNLTGYQVEELLAVNLIDIVHPEDQHLLRTNYRQTFTSTQVCNLEYRVICKDGVVKWVKDVANITYNATHQIFDIEGYITDITEKKAIKGLQKEYEDLHSELKQKYNDLMQFNYIVSHNLRSPIANIIGLTEILKFHYAEEASETGELVNYISDSVNSIDSIIQDLNLILSARKPINEKLEVLDLDEIIKSVKNNLKRQISESNAIIETSISPEVKNFKSIKSYIQSIFYNLISNSIKYSKDGNSPVISISAYKMDEHLAVEFKDNGIGMDLNHVGDILYGLYKKFNFDKEGKGLGLHMTKTQLESLGGKIEVQSAPDEGTTFKIILPHI